VFSLVNCGLGIRGFLDWQVLLYFSSFGMVIERKKGEKTLEKHRWDSDLILINYSKREELNTIFEMWKFCPNHIIKTLESRFDGDVTALF
jgi:hypothetical protein